MTGFYLSTKDVTNRIVQDGQHEERLVELFRKMIAELPMFCNLDLKELARSLEPWPIPFRTESTDEPTKTVSANKPNGLISEVRDGSTYPGHTPLVLTSCGETLAAAPRRRLSQLHAAHLPRSPSQDRNLMPPDVLQPRTDAAITATSRGPALPTAGGDAQVDTTFDATAPDEVDGGNDEPANILRENPMVDDGKTSERAISDELPQELSKLEQDVSRPEQDGTLTTAISSDATPIHNGDHNQGPPAPEEKTVHSCSTGAESSNVDSDKDLKLKPCKSVATLHSNIDADKELSADKKVDQTDVSVSKCNELRTKLSCKLSQMCKRYMNPLEKQNEQYMNPLERQNVLGFKEAIDAEQGSLTEDQYEAMIVEVKRIEKILKVRVDEVNNREASLNSLEDTMKRLSFVQAELHATDCKRAKSLVQKMKEQMKMDKYENPLVFCRDLDKLTKKIKKPRTLPIENFAFIPIEDFIFNAIRNDYIHFIGHLRNRFRDSDEYEMIKKSYLLSLQTGEEQPPRWFRIQLLGRGDDKVKIYVRSDNGYFVAFENDHGIFELGPGLKSVLSRLIPGSVFVGCSPDYPAMMNFERSVKPLTLIELQWRMGSLRLSLEVLLDAIKILSDYSHPPSEDDIEDDIRSFQIALAVIAIMICEASRIVQILALIDSYWRSGVTLSTLLLEYMWRWSRMSEALRQWRTNKWKELSPSLKDLVAMTYAEEVSEVIFLVINRAIGQKECGDGESELDAFPPADSGDDGKSDPPADSSNDGKPADAGGSSAGPDTSDQQPGGDSTHQQPGGDSEQPHKGFSASNKLRRNGDPGLINIIPYGPYLENPMADFLSRLKTPRLGTMLLCDWRLKHSYCSPSRGLSSVVDVNNKHTLHKRTVWKVHNRPPRPPPALASWTNCLVEVLEVSANFPFVGTIMLSDQRSSDTLYYADAWDKAWHDFVSSRRNWVSTGNASVDFKHKLELIGPSCAPIADGGFTIKSCIPATRRRSPDICKVTCSVDPRRYNEVKTDTIEHDRGCLYVTSVVLPEAVQGYVEIRLQLPSQWRGVVTDEWRGFQAAKIYGTITARVEKFNIGSTLFNKDVKEAVRLAVDVVPLSNFDQIAAGYTSMKVPLTRCKLAVPYGESVQFSGSLHVCGYDAQPITISQTFHMDAEDRWFVKSGDDVFYSVRMCLSPVF